MDFMNSQGQSIYPSDYPEQAKSLGRSLSIREQIQRERDMHSQEMKRLDAMIELIEENPAIEKFINLQRGYVG